MSEKERTGRTGAKDASDENYGQAKPGGGTRGETERVAPDQKSGEAGRETGGGKAVNKEPAKPDNPRNVGGQGGTENVR
jgi:hypothetical protein